MPVYYVNIIDTVNAEYTTVIENAAKSSLILSYKGNDQKDELSIVGSTFQFTLQVPFNNNTDAAYLHLFTGDEQRHKIEFRREDDDLLIWQGFLLPDNYSEPYKNGTFFIDFEATDGLGRLKGKFLPDEFYRDTKNVTSILAECLKLTGLNMPFYFSPAIENTNNKNYHQIYINTAIFFDGKKKDDAHKILKRFAENLLFCVFQSLGKWHLEGLNKRSLTTYKCKHYDVNGVYIEDLQITRSVKDVNGLALKTPTVTMVPPYGIIRVNNDREPVQFVETLATEKNDGWAVVTGVVGEIHVTDWWGTFDPKAKEPNYNVLLYSNNTDNFLESVYIKLDKQLYLQRGEKYKLSFKITVIDTEENQNNNSVNSWNNPVRYKIEFNGEPLFSNWIGTVTEREQIRVRNGKSATNTFEFVVDENGLLDFYFYQPFSSTNAVVAVQIDELNIERIGFNETEVFEDVLENEFTIVKDVDITLADDATGFTDAFWLEALYEPTGNVRQYTIPILYTFTQNGKQISVVQLDGANLIAENLSTSFHQTETVNIEEVIYNYENGEQMAVVHDFPNLTGNFIVNKPYKVQGSQDRSTWYQWTDSVYEVENQRFGKCYANILRRMHPVAHPKIDLTIITPVAFNDIIKFNYIDQSNFFITNLRSWDIDKGRVTLTINKAVYQNDDTINPGENIPPFVDAGPDIYIAQGVTSTNLTCVASDPDGFIAAFAWTQTTAEPGVTLVSPINQNTQVNGLTEDFYTFRITVTDNEGATAFDEVNVIRALDYEIELDLTNEVYEEIEDDDFEVVQNNWRRDYSIISTPALQDNLNVNISGYYRIIVFGDPYLQVTADSLCRVVKNGVNLINDFKNLSTLGTDSYDAIIPFTFNYNNTDTITINLETNAEVVQSGESATARVYFVVESIELVNGQGSILTTLPINIELTVTAAKI